MATTDEQKKAILPFLQRADEIGKVEPKVAYYCRLYAIQQGLALETRSAQIDGVLKALLSKLEKEKTTITLGEGDSQYCENFAITVFTRADRVDRAGRADKNTAMTFYAASIFFEILNQFKTLEADLVEMQRYAAWKAADIRKALREGRTPTPGAPGDDLTAGDVGMSSSAPQSQNGFDMPAAPGSGGTAASQGPTDEQTPTAPRFRAGSRILYNNDGVPVKGTVAKPNAIGEHSDYMVALSDRIVTSPESSLAPDLEAGDTVLYQSRGEEANATVVGVDASMWPPAYSVLLENGMQMAATYTQLTLLQHASTRESSRRQSLDQTAFQEAAAASEGSTSQPSHDASAPLPPGGLLTSQYGSAGETQGSSDVRARSDMSQALLFNTAGLEHNLAAAQRGDDVHLTGASDLDSLPEADSASPQGSNVPTRHADSTFASGPFPAPPQVQEPPPLPPPKAALPQTAAHQQTGMFEVPQAVAGFQPSLSSISEAQKLAKYAASSLGFEDVNTAVKQLTDALKLLTQPGAGSASKRR